jgi:hypothetical protein
MHALKILEFHLGPLLAWVHRGRLAVLFEAVAATVSGPRLTLTDIVNTGDRPRLIRQANKSLRITVTLYIYTISANAAWLQMQGSEPFTPTD